MKINVFPQETLEKEKERLMLLEQLRGRGIHNYR